jgi:hypothetical protein
MDILQGWNLIRARMELRARRARPRGEATDGRPAVRNVGDAEQGWDDNALFVDISGVAIVGLDFTSSSSVS